MYLSATNRSIAETTQMKIKVGGESWFFVSVLERAREKKKRVDCVCVNVLSMAPPNLRRLIWNSQEVD